MIPATTIVTEPTAEPLTLTEVKDSLRDTPVEDDALVSVLITASRRAAEAHTHRVFVTQTWIISPTCSRRPPSRSSNCRARRWCR